MTSRELPGVNISWTDVFGMAASHGPESFFAISEWSTGVAFFVGRNGTGKSRTARQLATRIPGGRHLSTDRLGGLMVWTNYGWGSSPNVEQQRGLPLGPAERQHTHEISQAHGSGVDEIYALREQPEVSLRVAAFVRRALGLTLELREVSGFLDPHIRVGDTVYSLLRDEGHGLRELVVLLAAAYRSDWSLLVVDEPELHLHPAMARLWLSELQAVCAATARSAVVVTHEPMLVRPTEVDDLDKVWLFSRGCVPRRVGEAILPGVRARVTPTLEENPDLVSQLVFSPRPVLVEGKHDVAALSVALARTQPRESVAQTDLVDCGGSTEVSLWFEIARTLGLDVRAIADLDALFTRSVSRTMDADPTVVAAYTALGVHPPTTHKALHDLKSAAGHEAVGRDERSKADWVAARSGDGHATRRDQVLEIWRDAGLWLHPQGRLEQVLGITEKGVSQAREAAARTGPIDVVAAWAAYALDPRGEVEELLGASIEQIAHQIMQALRLDPEEMFSAPIGPTAEFDALLVDVTPLQAGRHRLTVKTPDRFRGWWLEFDRDTPASKLNLIDPAGA